MTIRFLDDNDLAVYRELRLAGLKESPTAFGSSYVDEVDLPLTEFAARMRPHNKPENGIFGAFAEDRGLVGILGFAREHRVKRAHIASLWGMYVSSEFRGQGIGAALVDEAIAHARKLGSVRQIVLSVTTSNAAACGLYRSRGFERFGLERDAICLDGTCYDEEHLVMFLEKQKKEM